MIRATPTTLQSEKLPHPSPLPKGEGTDWGMLTNFADLKELL